MTRTRRYLLTAGRVLVIILSVLYLYHSISFSDIALTITTLGYPEFTGATLLVLGTSLLTSASLQILSSSFADIPFATLLRIHVMNLSLNSFIPSKAGSLATMPMLFDRYTRVTRSDGLSIQIIQLTVTAATLGTVTIFGSVLLRKHIGSELLIVLFASGSVYLLIPLVAKGVFSATRVPLLSVPIGAVDSSQIHRDGVYYSLLLTSVSVIVLVGLRFFVLSLGLDVRLPYTYYLFVPTLMYAVSVLPVSFGGMGISEVTGTSILVSIGIAPEAAGALVVLDRSLSYYLPVLLAHLYTWLEL